LHESSRGRRGYGEAARLGDRGDVDVQPLAREVVEGRLLSMKVLERCLASFKGCVCDSVKYMVLFELL
jgi:hypothetical protein